MDNPESKFIIPATLPAFELAMEDALADFFKLAWGGTGGPLDGVRILAGVRDFDLTADGADPSPSNPAAVKADANERAEEAIKPRLYFVGRAYQRETGQDRCEIKVRIEANLKHSNRAIFAALLSHVRAVLSVGYQDWFTKLFNDHTSTVFLQGIEQPAAPSLNAFWGLSAVCEEVYTVGGGLLPPAS